MRKCEKQVIELIKGLPGDDKSVEIALKMLMTAGLFRTPFIKKRYSYRALAMVLCNDATQVLAWNNLTDKPYLTFSTAHAFYKSGLSKTEIHGVPIYTCVPFCNEDSIKKLHLLVGAIGCAMYDGEDFLKACSTLDMRRHIEKASLVEYLERSLEET